MRKNGFKFEFSTLKLGKNGYFCACLNFFVNQCYLYKERFPVDILIFEWLLSTVTWKNINIYKKKLIK